ncbi:MAG: response regulator transcription factor [Acidobacteria bacterium]|nr:response regulator transcription factor [Acidobacteriota bacterium]MDA1235494.1 response regulator transcription factor [Acidobacteriota bacterium]
MISVCLCDPQPVVQRGLQGLLEHNDKFRLLAASSQLAKIDELMSSSPDVLIIERSFGMHTALEAITQLKQTRPRLKVVVWASQISDIESFRLLQAGARGILKKTASPELIYHCLERVADNHLWTEDLFNSPQISLEQPRNRPLTPREAQVASLVAKGMKNREIGEALGIATGTVKIHLMHIFEKTGIRDRFELALRGLRNATEKDRGAAPATEAAPAVVPLQSS